MINCTSEKNKDLVKHYQQIYFYFTKTFDKILLPHFVSGEYLAPLMTQQILVEFSTLMCLSKAKELGFFGNSQHGLKTCILKCLSTNLRKNCK